jgi:hypothetical protein
LKTFSKYCQKKNKINSLLATHYSQFIFRKLRFNSFINTQKSESKMINNFKNKFGPYCTIVMGDYDKKDHMKGKEPTISKRIKKIFKNNGYKLYLLNEFRTSILCNKCEERCEKFMYRESHRPKDIDKETKKGKKILVHGLLRCTNVNCKIIHNRDKNACMNMYKIVKNIIKGRGRPKRYRREEFISAARKSKKAETPKL